MAKISTLASRVADNEFGTEPGDALPLVVVLLGPTASGKTALGIALAKELQLDVINVDSRQLYRDMSVGTAKPTPAQQAEVPHHLLDCLLYTSPSPRDRQKSRMPSSA